MGPCEVVSKEGNSSYVVSTYDEGQKEVHISQLKPYIENPVTGDSVPLHYFRPGTQPSLPTPWVEGICDHRYQDDGSLQFLVRWCDTPSTQDTWLSPAEFIPLGENDIWK